MLYFILGMFTGSIVTVFTMSLLIMSKKSDEAAGYDTFTKDQEAS